MSRDARGAEPPEGGRAKRYEDAPLWRQALVGIGYVAAGALVVIGLGAVLSVVVSWVF